MRMISPELSVLADLLRAAMAAGQMPFLTVSSGSMAPLLRVGDEVGVQPVSLAQLHRGDVVVVCDEDQTVTHRFYRCCTAKSDVTFVTRGDRSRIYDRAWAASQLLGRVVVRRRKQQLLWLDFGAGQWLNRRLALVANVEQQALSRWPHSEARAQRTATPYAVRATCRALAEALTLVVETVT